MNAEYRAMKADRDALGLPPLPLAAPQTAQICSWLADGKPRPPDGDEDLVELLADRVPAGSDPATAMKGAFLARAAAGELAAAGLTPEDAIALLGTMRGHFSLQPLLDRLADADAARAEAAAHALSGCIFADAVVDQVDALRRAGNVRAGEVMASWAAADWFTAAPALPARAKLAVCRVAGEVTADDLCPAGCAAEGDIPARSLALGGARFSGVRAELARLAAEADRSRDRSERLTRTPFHSLRIPAPKPPTEAERMLWGPAFVADALAGGTDCRAAAESLAWMIGHDVPHVPNLRRGGVAAATRIDPAIRDALLDAGCLPLVADAAKLSAGMHVAAEFDLAGGRGRFVEVRGGELTAFAFPPRYADIWRAGGRRELELGQALSARAAGLLGRPAPDVFAR